MKKIITCILAFAACAPVNAQLVTSGLVEYFSFNNSVVGVNGSTLNTNASKFYADRGGVAGNAYFADAVANVIVNSTVANIPQGNADRSVAFWFKRKSNATHTLFSYSPLNDAFAIVIDNGPLSVFHGGNAVATKTMTYDTLWHHVAVTHNSLTTRLYYDNVLEASGTATFTNNDNQLRFGRSSYGGDYANFVIDEVYIFNRVISTAEISALSPVITGIGETRTAGSLRCYPNPGTSVVKILNSGVENGQLTITKTDGAVILEKQTGSEAEVEVDLSAYSNGTYFVELKNKTGVYRTKILKN